MDNKTHIELASDITIAWINAIGSLRSSTTHTPAFDTFEFLQKPENITDFYDKILTKINGK